MKEMTIEQISRGLESSAPLSNLLGVSKILVMQSDLNDLLNVIMTEATRIMNADRSTLFLVNDVSGELISYIAQQAEITEIRLPIGRGICGHVARTGEVVNLDDAYDSDLFDSSWDKKTGYRTKSVLCVPMRNPTGKVVGVLQVLNREDGSNFNKADEAALSLFASHAAISIDNVRLHDDLKLVFTSAMRALAEAVDRRDPGTAGHSERVTYYAVRLGQAMGLEPAEATALEYAATLHDIGKIGVPDNILTKPDRLSDEEFETIKEHAAISRSILEKFYFTGANTVVPFVAGAHHERLDGSGYPEGLGGGDLPLPCRILAVADVYDAITSFDRHYRGALTAGEALAVLKKEAHDKLDAKVVQAFIEEELYVIERRRFVRLDMHVTIEYKIMPRDRMGLEIASKTAWTRDIAGRGLSFISREFIPAGTFLQVSIHLDGEIIELLAKVLRIERIEQSQEFESSIMFLYISNEAQERLQDYLVEMTPAARK